MIRRRWVQQAALWTALTRASTGFVATNAVAGGSLFARGPVNNALSQTRRQCQTTLAVSIKQNESSSALDKSIFTNSSFSTSDESSSTDRPPPPKRFWSRKWRRPLGVSLSVLGFCQSAMYAVFTPGRPPKVRRVIRALRRYLRETSIDEEFTSILNYRLVGNFLILRRIQRQLMIPIAADQSSLSSNLPCPFESLRLMKYATAVYGDAMIRAAELELDDRFDVGLLGTPSQEQVRKHCRLKDADEIISFDIDYSGDSTHLRHMIVADHTHKKIVLAIRGTFSLSEIAVDIAAFSRPFCDGEAHSEMANMAELVWTKAQPSIEQLKTKHPDYELIVTGHSLGGGVACLVHMMLLAKEVDNTFYHPRCVAFAAPPTISRHNPLERCVNFIHDQDVVPFLSVDSIRRLCQSVQTIDDEHMRLPQRWRAIQSDTWSNEKLFQRLKDLPPVSARDGAPALQSAAKTNVWLRRHDMAESSFFEDEVEEDYKVEVWSANKLANVGIRLELTQDHLPSLYEHALSKWAQADALDNTA